MSTRAQVRFATRETGQSFSEHPEKIHAQFYVHSDGYPEHLGMEIAESYENYDKVNNWEIEHVQDVHTDLDYIYYIWSDYDKETWISIFKTPTFNGEEEKCIFVGQPNQLIEKYEIKGDNLPF